MQIHVFTSDSCYCKYSEDNYLHSTGEEKFESVIMTCLPQADGVKISVTVSRNHQNTNLKALIKALYHMKNDGKSFFSS